MPVIKIYSILECPSNEFLKGLAYSVAEKLNISNNKVWVLWQKISLSECYKEDWINNPIPAPIFQVICREVYSKIELKEVINTIIEQAILTIKCSKDEIFITFHRVQRGELFSFGNIWE